MKNSSNISINVGISGCKIEFQDDKVIKSSSLEYGPRLLKQAQKQHFFSKNFNFSGIQSPHIFKILKKPLSFHMKRSKGLGWEEYFNNCSIRDISNITKILENYITQLGKENLSQNCSAKIQEKLISLYPKSNHKKFIKWLIKKSNQNLMIPYSFCHGDLSFLNILFEPQGLVFIDFLDSFVDSYIIDIIKLRQDARYEFCLKYSDIKSLKISRIFNKINKSIEEKFKEEINSEAFQILEAINYLRIEPYAPKDKQNIINNILIQTPIYQKFLEF